MATVQKRKNEARYTAAASPVRLRKAAPPATPDDIPPELRALRRWVVWDYIDYRNGKKPRKVPVTPNKDHGLSWNTSSNWRMFDEVVQEATEREGLGIGFVFDEADGFIGVDLDDAYDSDENLKPWAKEVCARFQHTYGERTPSGKGIHFIGLGDRVNGDKRVVIASGITDAVERYSQDRWFTFTGEVVADKPVCDVRDAMRWLADAHFDGQGATPEAITQAVPSGDPELDTELAKVCVELLSSSRASDAEEWRRVGYACKGVGESLYPAWLEFSKQWPDCDVGECEDRWRRFRSRSTVGTLVQMAGEDSGRTAIQLRDAARDRLGREPWKPSRVIVNANTARGAERADAVRSTPQWTSFPEQLLPSGVRDYVVQTADGMACESAMVALPTLAGLAACIGNTRTITIKDDWSEPAILWTAIVAESGSLKTPAQRKALQFITQHEHDIEQHNAQVREQYDSDHIVWETQLAGWKQQARKTGDNAGPPPVKPARPGRIAYIVSDTTIEAVVGILADNPRGLLLERDEISGWLAGFDKYKSGGAGRVSSEVGHWLSMHNAGTLRLDRKSTGRVYVERASLSITGGIQPDTLTLAVGQEHVANGLLARFLLAAPPRRPKQFNTKTADFAAVESARRVFDTLLGIAMPENGPVPMPLTADGERAFKTFYERHAARQMEATGVVASMLAKAEASAARFALIHHVCRQAGDEPTLPNAVDAESIEVGIGLAEWFADEWLRVYESTVGCDPKGNRDDDLLTWIESQGGQVAVRQIGQRMRRYRDAEALERVITGMAHDGRLETFSVHNEQGGPPAQWVRLPSTKPTPK
jgi:hypothetical protein